MTTQTQIATLADRSIAWDVEHNIARKDAHSIVQQPLYVILEGGVEDSELAAVANLLQKARTESATSDIAGRRADFFQELSVGLRTVAAERQAIAAVHRKPDSQSKDMREEAAQIAHAFVKRLDTRPLSMGVVEGMAIVKTEVSQSEIDSDWEVQAYVKTHGENAALPAEMNQRRTDAVLRELVATSILTQAAKLKEAESVVADYR